MALGRALIAEAPVCLLDEPLSNLDAQLRQDLRREIRALQQRLGITMIYVTHDQTEAMSMADRVILMRAGRIEQNGAPAELYERPATLFAARFIGGAPMSFLDLDDGPDGAVIAGTAGPALFAAPGRGRVLGLRPEDVTVETGNGRGRFHARVTAVEYLGAEALVTCTIGERTILARTRGDGAPPVGATVGLTWDASAAHVFDAASGQRVAIDPAADRRAAAAHDCKSGEELRMNNFARPRSPRRWPPRLWAARPRRRPRSPSIIRSRSAARSPRSSMAMPPNSTRRIPTSR